MKEDSFVSSKDIYLALSGLFEVTVIESTGMNHLGNLHRDFLQRQALSLSAGQIIMSTDIRLYSFQIPSLCPGHATIDAPLPIIIAADDEKVRTLHRPRVHCALLDMCFVIVRHSRI